MENKYTKLCKRVMVVSMVISIICVFVLGFMVKGWFSFVVVIGGIVLVLAAHSFWGIFIEMSGNIIRIGDKMTDSGEKNKS